MLKFMCEVEKNSYTHLEKSIIHSLKAKIDTKLEGEKRLENMYLFDMVKKLMA